MATDIASLYNSETLKLRADVLLAAHDLEGSGQRVLYLDTRGMVLELTEGQAWCFTSASLAGATGLTLDQANEWVLRLLVDGYVERSGLKAFTDSKKREPVKTFRVTSLGRLWLRHWHGGLAI